MWVPPRSHVGDAGVTHGCHRGHVDATMCGWHQGHIGWHPGHMCVPVVSCGCHCVWVPPRSHVGDAGVTHGCHRSHVGATMSGWHQGHIGWHQGHMWVSVGTCGCHRVWVPPKSHWVPPRSHVGDAGVTHGCHGGHAGATMCGWHQGHMWVPVGMCGCHQVWVPPRSCLGGTKVTCGCQWGHEGATKCGCHQGHIGGTEAMCVCGWGPMGAAGFVWTPSGSRG